MSEMAIQLTDVVQKFGSHTVLNGITLKVPTGQTVALFGPSGSGKTTVLNIIGTLLKPTHGQVNVLGHNLRKLSAAKCARLRRRWMGFVFQSTTLLPVYSAAENIDVALRLKGAGYFERRRKTRDMLDRVGLSEWADHRPAELSGGQRQRIAIARVLAIRPALILADEPTNGLDTQTTRQIMGLFREIADEQGTTFLMVSHDPLVTESVDVVYNLDNGRIVKQEQHSSLAETTEKTPLQERTAQ